MCWICAQEQRRDPKRKFGRGSKLECVTGALGQATKTVRLPDGRTKLWYEQGQPGSDIGISYVFSEDGLDQELTESATDPNFDKQPLRLDLLHIEQQKIGGF